MQVSTFPVAAVPGEGAEREALDGDIAALAPLLQRVDTGKTLAALLKIIARARAMGKDGVESLTNFADRLRKNRAFDDLYLVTTEMRSAGMADAKIQRWEIQALTELGVYRPALDLARKWMVSGVQTSEGREAYGAIGRIYKQLYVDGAAAAEKPPKDVLDLYLRRSYAAYAKVWDALKTAPAAYQGVNALAVAARAEADGSPIRGVDAPNLANDLLAALANPQEVWDLATRAETLIALGRYEEAATTYGNFALHPEVDLFQLTAALRQLVEVWRLDGEDAVKGAPVRQLKTLLLAKLGTGEKQTGTAAETTQTTQVHISPAEIDLITKDAARIQAAAAAPPPKATGDNPKGLEQVFALNAPTAYSVILNAIDRARSLCRIHAMRGREDVAFATGFVVEGRQLYEPWGDEPVVVTNNHVISSRPGKLVQRKEMCQAVFFGLEPTSADKPQTQVRISFGDILWESDVDAHDITILRLAGPLPPFVRPIRDMPKLPLPPRADDDEGIGRVYVIGFPAGGELSFSFADNILLDHDAPTTPAPTQGGPPETDIHAVPKPIHLHYKTPTLGGSSGSPVFDFSDFSLLGVHHQGSPSCPRLAPRPGAYAANEGIWIESIRAAIKESEAAFAGSGAPARWGEAPPVVDAPPAGTLPTVHPMPPSTEAARPAPGGAELFLPGAPGDTSGGTSRVAAQVLREGKASEAEVTSLGRESVFGMDDRTRIFETNLSPWRMICALRCRWGKTLAVGTGFLVSPSLILTAGHVTFPKNIRTKPDSIEVFPGLNGVEQPYGKIPVAAVSVHPNWETGFDMACDISAIYLAEPIGQRIGWFGVASRPPEDLRLDWSHVSGYPGEKLDQPQSAEGAPQPPVQAAQLWHHSSPIITVNENRIFYATDTTGGQSGSPIYILDKAKSPTPVVVGVHAYGKASTPVGVGDANSGAWISPAMFDIIRHWRDGAQQMLEELSRTKKP